MVETERNIFGDRYNRPKLGDRINKNPMTKYFWPYDPINWKPDDWIYLPLITLFIWSSGFLFIRSSGFGLLDQLGFKLGPKLSVFKNVCVQSRFNWFWKWGLNLWVELWENNVFTQITGWCHLKGFWMH